MEMSSETPWLAAWSTPPTSRLLEGTPRSSPPALSVICFVILVAVSTIYAVATFLDTVKESHQVRSGSNRHPVLGGTLLKGSLFELSSGISLQKKDPCVKVRI